jgi:uncharacterized membrane protein (UPF0182 family)
LARIPDDIRRTRRRLLLWLGLGVGALAVALGALSGFYIDILWFREVDHSAVFWTRFWSRLVLGAVFGVAFFALLYANLLIVRRLRPRHRVFSPEEEVVERYRAAFEPYVKWVLPGVALFFGALAGASIAGEWETFQLWRASGDITFGIADPVFERDAAFFVLTLPFQKLVQAWILGSLVTITVICAAGHYLWGGIRVRAMADRVTPQVKAHLSVLLGLIVLVKAWGYRLGQFDLLVSERGVVTGASYTDVNAHLQALKLLVVIAILCSVLFLVNIRFRGWALPVAGIGLLVVTSVVAGALWPAIVQRLSVAPQELQRERPFIDRNIEFTRHAYGLDQVETRPFPAAPEVTPEEIEQAEETVDNIRLWNPEVLKQSYLQLQRIRPYYEFTDVDVDRYQVGDRRALTMITAREIDQQGIQGGGQTWQNQHLFYTHGFGAAASRVDQVTPEGAPEYILRDIPVTGALAPTLEQPRIYFGETAPVPYVITGTNSDEFDFPQSEEGDEQFARYRYDGTGGIEAGGFMRRLAFAWRYRDVNLLISGLIEPDSRILVNTDLRTRVMKIAPFLQYDYDPYNAIVDGRIVWIWDAYTASSSYPYSQHVDLGELTDGHLSGGANYIRNSVKVVVDAYDGTTTFYLADEEDPIIQAWSRVFPDLFTPLDEASEDLRAHLRYPEDLFRVQSNQFANYHVTDAAQFYAKEDFWSIPVVSAAPEGEPSPLAPYYVLLRLPGQEEEGQRFVLFSPFTPADRPNMVAWLAADSDPENYGRLVGLEFQGENVPGPANAAALISQDTDVAQQVTLLGQLGSRVIYGDLLAIPIGQSFLYVQPLYTRSAQEASAIPEMKRVILVNGGDVSMAPSLTEALAAEFGEAVPEPPEPAPGEPQPPPTVGGTVAELVAEAVQHILAANDALAAQDLAGFQREFEEAEAVIDRVCDLLPECQLVIAEALNGSPPQEEASPES